MFGALRDAADGAEAVPEWGGYAAYCRLREQGLRQQSLDRLNAFIADQGGTDFECRLAFVRWLMPRADDASDGDLLIPQPLYDRLIRPTLEEWTLRMPQEAWPHFWLGLREHRREKLRRAVELDPCLTGARVRLAGYLLGDLEHAECIGHDLARSDASVAAAIREARALITGLPESDMKRDLSEEVQGYCGRLGIDC
jgi:hypothetical protein